MFAKLADMTGNDDFNPKTNSLKDIIIEFQVVMGMSRTDGVFDSETMAALKDAIKSSSEDWAKIQNDLQILGYGQYSGFVTGKSNDLTSKAIEQFQIDWNWFVDHLEYTNPNIEYKAPYTKTTPDGIWGPATSARLEKILVKFDNVNPVEVEGLAAPVYNFHSMIVELQQL